MNSSTPTYWYTLNLEEVLKRLDTNKEGLTTAKAKKRREETKANSLDIKEDTGVLRLLVRQINNPLIYLLMGAGILSLSFNHRADAAVIAGVIILNTLLGFFQEWRAEGALKALRNMSVPRSFVLRDGKSTEIDSSEVVIGDVLVLETGRRVAADAMILSGENLHVDESALTGESQPVAKNPGIIAKDTPVADRNNTVWMSTNVTGGRGLAVVVETGMQTEMGQIAGQVRGAIRESTPLQKRMQKLGIILGVGGVVLAGGVAGLGLLRGNELVEMLMFAVAVAVSAIPEGLPAVISVTLALGVRRMASRNAIIKRMSAVETLGSTTVICSDKTGTITQNQMTVRMLWAGGQAFEVSGEGYRPEGEIKNAGGERVGEVTGSLKNLLLMGALSNNAHLKQEGDMWRVEGSPSEGALLTVAGKGSMDINRIRQDWRRLAELTFSNDNKYMATLHQKNNSEERVAYIKGAPERIISFCTHTLQDGKLLELNEDLRREIITINEQYASKAMRVMAGAFREMQKGTDSFESADIEAGLTFVGLWSMIDPPREDTAQAVRDARGAGIRPVMITGDHAITALAIARQVGIAGNGQVLTGRDIETMEKSDLAKAALEVGVFARVAPAHKLKLMEALKENGHIVAMTGDGVNDAPALKGADIGIAMGRSGTEVAKEAADMVLTDDNFATIVHAVEEGRVIYSNLRRVVYFLLTTNLGEILILASALILGFDLPLTAVMILWINLITDGACTVPLGIEPRHSDVLKLPPRNPKTFIIDRPMILRMGLLMPIMVVGTLGLFWNAQREGNLNYARTVAFATMAVFQWFQAFSARSNYQSIFTIGLFSNKSLLAGVGIAILMQLGAIHTTLGHKLFGTVNLSLKAWLLIIAVSSSIWIADEIFKKIGVYGKVRS